MKGGKDSSGGDGDRVIATFDFASDTTVTLVVGSGGLGGEGTLWLRCPA